MSLLSMVEAKLPPGFRFHPRDEELVCDYLMKKVMSTDGNGTSSHSSPYLVEVDLNNCEPWDLPEAACVGGKQWYFYSQRDRKYATGARTNRATISGYWKATGKDRRIVSKGFLVGMKKTLVFYQGRAPKGRKTNWVMHEHRIEGPYQPTKHSFQEDWVLCRVFYKSKRVSIKSINVDQEDYCDDADAPVSSSPPPLTSTDHSYITFDQTPPTTKEYVQVPCFSISTSPQQTNPNLSHLAPTIPAKNLGHLEGLPHDSDIDPFACDNSKVIRVVLDHLTKLETKGKAKGDLSPSFGESGNYLSVMGFPTMINY